MANHESRNSSVKHRAIAAISLGALMAAGVGAGCGSDDPPPAPLPAENAGSTCKAASECYPGVDGGALSSAPICLDKVTNGYCTHVCQADIDCCAVPGECKTGYPQVCSPFESQPDKYCLLSCGSEQLKDAGTSDADAYCSTYAHAGFTCRSSGGGASNRKVCMP